MTERWLYCHSCGSSWFTIEETEYGIELACWECESYIGVHLKDEPKELSFFEKVMREFRKRKLI